MAAVLVEVEERLGGQLLEELLALVAPSSASLAFLEPNGSQPTHCQSGESSLLWCLAACQLGLQVGRTSRKPVHDAGLAP